jgi:hypothetical protein
VWLLHVKSVLLVNINRVLATQLQTDNLQTVVELVPLVNINPLFVTQLQTYLVQTVVEFIPQVNINPLLVISTTDRVCTICPNNSFCTGDAATECDTTCPSGQYQTAACNSTSNISCPYCRTCKAGTHETLACTSLSDRVCLPCPGNTSSPEGSTDKIQSSAKAGFYINDKSELLPCSLGVEKGMSSSCSL